MRLLTLLAIILVASLGTAPPTFAQTELFDLERIERATVFVMQAQDTGDNLYTTCVGSGTLVSRDGLILTHAHSTLRSVACPGESLVIGVSTRLGEPPIPKFRAEIAQADAGLDLAILRITRELDGRLIEAGSITFPFVELVDSSTSRLDETVIVAGFPGIGDDPVNITRGTIIGFVAEPRGQERAWIKTSASIPGVMSGGGAYNQFGELIGVPTTAPITGRTGTTSCVPIQDTNSDGIVNNSDICIATGGFINALRPSNFAQTLLRAASLNLNVGASNNSGTQSVPQGTPTFKRLFFAPAVNEAGMPTSVIRSLPAGSNSLYLFFDYENMSPETVYELRVTTDGRPNATFSLAPVRWSGGERGMWHIGSSEQPWPNGVYEFTLFANGIAAPTARLIVGAAPETSPTFGDIAFGLLDLRNNPLGNGFVLPSGNVASARFIYRNMENGAEWTTIWYLNGAEIPNSRQTNLWTDGPTGTTTTSVRSETGLPPGIYRLELYIGDRLAATSDFTIAGAQQGAFPQIFTNTHFTTADTPEEALTAPPISTFSDRVDRLFALFDWQQIARGTLWTIRWSVDGEPFYDQTTPWLGAESGTGFMLQLNNNAGIPDGTYTVDLLVNNVQLASARVQVGIGQLPIDRFAQASGVQLRGTIIDADTQVGIPGVSIVVISKDFSVEEFTETRDQSQVFAIAVTDSNGYFEIDQPLEISTDALEVAYSAIITVEGYLPLSADGLEVTEETPNPLDIVIELTRD